MSEAATYLNGQISKQIDELFDLAYRECVDISEGLDGKVSVSGGSLKSQEIVLRRIARGDLEVPILRRMRGLPIEAQAEESTDRPYDPGWIPDPAPECFHGLAGDIVRQIEEHTEADPLGLMVQLLAAVGSAVGRGPHQEVLADRHGSNLFCMMVGDTSKGRKGTSWGIVKRLMKTADRDWYFDCLKSGISSGEGLIYHVRDPVGRDEGVTDKRLLVMESEFGRVLQASRRKESTASAIIREAWDGDNLRTLTKNSPLQARDPHISIIGHITRTELLKLITQSEQCNGFANRFLWVAVRRSKVLPEVHPQAMSDLMHYGGQLRDVVEAGKQVGPMRRSPEAQKLWREVYERLSEGNPGILGAITGRGEAQVIRLSTIYALLDQSKEIRLEHLEAALAIWEVSVNSCRWVFGDALGDDLAETILIELRDLKAAGSEWVARTHITKNVLSGRYSARRIGVALDLLHGCDLVRCRIVRQPNLGRGRPREEWAAA